jgi:hypothetical protein
VIERQNRGSRDARVGLFEIALLGLSPEAGQARFGQQDQAALESARSARTCLSRLWLATPVDGLEALFEGNVGAVYRKFLKGVLPALPLDGAETAWKASLSEYLLGGFERSGSLNVLLALLQLQVAQGRERNLGGGEEVVEAARCSGARRCGNGASSVATDASRPKPSPLACNAACRIGGAAASMAAVRNAASREVALCRPP